MNGAVVSSLAVKLRMSSFFVDVSFLPDSVSLTLLSCNTRDTQILFAKAPILDNATFLSANNAGILYRFLGFL